MKLAVDASPLILFVVCGHFELLPGLATEVVIPSAVLRELEAGESQDQAAARVRSASWATIASPLPILPEIAAWDLGLGETAVLTWVAEHSDFTAVLDDRAARNCARSLGIPVVGTLGLVLAAKEAGLLSAARPVLKVMKQAGYYLAGEILERSLRSAGE